MRSRARQRPLVGPMLPTGSPSSSEISAYEARRHPEIDE